MPSPICSDDEFIALWEKHKSAARVASELQADIRSLHRRRIRIEQKYGIVLASDTPQSPPMQVRLPQNGVRVEVDLFEGVVLVGSDAHYWPGIISTAHRAFVTAAKELKPSMIIMNGDAFDGATASRHPRIQYEQRPTILQELQACKDRLGEIEAVAANAKLHWTWGNHDARFNSRLSQMVPEFEGVAGFNLTDHFPRWRFSTSVMVNGHTQIKHRVFNGLHAAFNAVVKSGVSTINGHLHSLKVTPWTDLRGTRYGVDTGSLADVWGDQFNYTEDSTRNHRAGFAVLTFREGKLMPPELLEVIDEDQGLVFFRGQVAQV